MIIGCLLIAIIVGVVSGGLFFGNYAEKLTNELWQERVGSASLGEFEFSKATGKISFTLFSEEQVVKNYNKNYNKKYPETL